MCGLGPFFCFSISDRSFHIAASGAMDQYQEHCQENKEQLRIFTFHDVNGGDREVGRWNNGFLEQDEQGSLPVFVCG